MGKLLANSLFRTIIIVIIVSLVLAGAVYAYQTIWSGKGHITIVGPSPVPEVEVTGITADADGDWDDASNTWAAAIVKNQSTHLKIHLKNQGTTTAIIRGYVNGQKPSPVISIGPIFVQADDLSLAGGESGSITFTVSAYPYAEAGTLSEFELELRGPFPY